MVGLQTNTTLVGRLRIRSKSFDPQAEQQRIARMLRSATLHPAGLPESSMLVVRRLADPLPSRFRAGPLDILPDASWQRAVASALERLAASAARPAYGAVPGEVEAVLFYDRAEVLASLALDWMSGALSIQWWWRELLRGRDVITALLREWIEAPQYVPSAIDLLAKRKHAVQFVQRLPHQAAGEMLGSVLKAYGFPRPCVDVAAEQMVSEDHDEPPAKLLDIAKTPILRETVALPSPALPWVPEAATPGLLPVQKMLLVQALMLRRAPAIARTMAFQKKLLLWQARAENAAVNEMNVGTATESAHRASSQKSSVPVKMEQVAITGTIDGHQSAFPSNEAQHGIELESAEESPAIQTGNEGIRELLRPEVKSRPQGEMPAKDGSVAIAGQQQQVPLEQEVVSIPDRAPATEGQLKEVKTGQTAEPSTTLETEYGGVFFLLSLSLYLYIYGDFTSPTEPELELNIWDFLALMARELTGGAIEKDRLWDELASLAGRPRSVRPGLGFDPPNEWRLPAEWLLPFSEVYDPQPTFTNGRMIATHPAGFTVIDVPADGNVQSTMEEFSPADRLHRWVSWMASYFRARLVRALGREDAVILLCTRPARVDLTLTHIDVTFSLDHHPIELRMAGLDRDLGWIPAAGRYLAFHFK